MRVVTLNPMLHFEIQPRMFPSPHQQCVGDEYPRAPVLRSSTTTIRVRLFLRPMSRIGLEPSGVSTEFDERLQNEPCGGGALSGAEKPIFEHFSPELQQVIDAWADPYASAKHDNIHHFSVSQEKVKTNFLFRQLALDTHRLTLIMTLVAWRCISAHQIAMRAGGVPVIKC
jgi:hypothetical protein